MTKEESCLQEPWLNLSVITPIQTTLQKSLEATKKKSRRNPSVQGCLGKANILTTLTAFPTTLSDRYAGTWANPTSPAPNTKQLTTRKLLMSRRKAMTAIPRFCCKDTKNILKNNLISKKNSPKILALI